MSATLRVITRDQADLSTVIQAQAALIQRQFDSKVDPRESERQDIYIEGIQITHAIVGYKNATESVLREIEQVLVSHLASKYAGFSLKELKLARWSARRKSPNDPWSDWIAVRIFVEQQKTIKKGFLSRITMR